MKRTTKWMLLMLLMLPIAYCANAQKKLSAKAVGVVALQSEPAGAKVYLDGKLVCPSTPGSASIKQEVEVYYDKKKDDAKYAKKAEADNTLVFTFVKDGYIVGQEELVPSITLQRLPIVGAQMYAIYPSSLLHVFQEDPTATKSVDNSIPKGEETKVVNRDKPGQTALERTIIRWYFESEPQGARIFWRVISSIPDQVKNTNELWLGNTPYEETRSFNIQGLTYENSRDVQIEIKVRCNGYVDQTKRFNVRQAIDQQEISSFFDMIKKAE